MLVQDIPARRHNPGERDDRGGITNVGAEWR